MAPFSPAVDFITARHNISKTIIEMNLRDSVFIYEFSRTALNIEVMNTKQMIRHDYAVTVRYRRADRTGRRTLPAMFWR